jgi:hypothetical protein
MSKGHKEAKKPKTKPAHLPNPPALPGNLVQPPVGAPRGKKR